MFSCVSCKVEISCLFPTFFNALASLPTLGYGAKQEPLILTAVTKVEEVHVPEEEHWPEEFQVLTVENKGYMY